MKAVSSVKAHLNMETFLIILHTAVCLFLIMVVLLQTGKGGGMGGAFGGSSQTVFGGRGAGTFLTRLTAFSAVAFMLTSIALAYLSSSGESSLKKKSESMAAKGALKTDAGLPPEEPLTVPDAGIAKPSMDAGAKPAVDGGATKAQPVETPKAVPAANPSAPKPAAPPEAPKETEADEPEAPAQPSQPEE